MNLYKDGILITIKVRFWTGVKTLSPDDFALQDNLITLHNTIKLPYFGKKDLLPKKVIHQFRAIESRARFLIENSSFKFPIGNARFIPHKRFKLVEKTLKKYQREYNKLIDELIINYDDLREKIFQNDKEMAVLMYKTYQSTLIETEEKFVNYYFSVLDNFYPDKNSLRKKFSLNWDVFEITPPETSSINYSGYTKEIKNKFETFLFETVRSLRYRTVELCKQIIQKMDTGTVIKGPTIRSLRLMINDFLDLNFIGDTDIENNILELQKEFINKYNIRQISGNSNLQNELKDKLQSLLEKAKVSSGIDTVTKQYKNKTNQENLK